MAQTRRLNRDEVQRVVEHAIRTHRLAEAERERVAECSDIPTLRAALLEAGLPPEDVERSLASVDEVLGRSGRRRSTVIATVAVGVTAAAVAGALALYRPAPAAVFVNLSRELPGRPASPSWRGGSIRGDAERVLLDGFRARGARVIERLDPKASADLFVGASAEPSRAELRRIGAGKAVLGTLRCRSVEKGHAAELSVQVIDLDSGAQIGGARADATYAGQDAERACEVAGAAAARVVIGRLTRTAP